MLLLHSRIVELGYKVEATWPRKHNEKENGKESKNKSGLKNKNNEKTEKKNKKPGGRHRQLASQSSHRPRMSPRSNLSPCFLSSKCLRLRSNQTDHQTVAVVESFRNC